ncbi:hypothetical protein [Thermus sp.]|uniref:hypothetical protein n=1 Tax=Thermus sp. TaxID=275 RepID=UPI0025E942DB|nr:hypothetical protein [Thermus sp.]MCS6868372.1 hypothetical protein [Thermus sp.]MDW8358607.1 hypothetical protein [Thermus sp.]
MGYTHYWLLREEEMERVMETLPLIVADFKKFLPHLPPLAGPQGKGKPEFGEDRVGFNGPEPDDYESFFFPDSRPEGFPYSEDSSWRFAFCKTGRRPYDLAVQVFLLLAKLHLGKAMRLRSDGSLVEWVPAAELVERVLGASLDLPSLLDRTFLLFRDGKGRPFLYEVTLGSVGEKVGERRDLLREVEEYLPHPFKPGVVLEGVGIEVPLREIQERHIRGDFYSF